MVIFRHFTEPRSRREDTGSEQGTTLLSMVSNPLDWQSGEAQIVFQTISELNLCAINAPVFGLWQTNPRLSHFKWYRIHNKYGAQVEMDVKIKINKHWSFYSQVDDNLRRGLGSENDYLHPCETFYVPTLVRSCLFFFITYDLYIKEKPWSHRFCTHLDSDRFLVATYLLWFHSACFFLFFLLPNPKLTMSVEAL